MTTPCIKSRAHMSCSTHISPGPHHMTWCRQYRLPDTEAAWAKEAEAMGLNPLPSSSEVEKVEEVKRGFFEQYDAAGVIRPGTPLTGEKPKVLDEDEVVVMRGTDANLLGKALKDLGEETVPGPSFRVAAVSALEAVPEKPRLELTEDGFGLRLVGFDPMEKILQYEPHNVPPGVTVDLTFTETGFKRKDHFFVFRDEASLIIPPPDGVSFMVSDTDYKHPRFLPFDITYRKAEDPNRLKLSPSCWSLLLPKEFTPGDAATVECGDAHASIRPDIGGGGIIAFYLADFKSVGPRRCVLRVHTGEAKGVYYYNPED